MLRLSPLVLIVFLGFLTIGIPLPAIPVHVHETLGRSTVAAGWAIGIQSIATVLTRYHAGIVCDARGPKLAVLLGLPLASLAGLTYLISAHIPGPWLSFAVLLTGRVILGAAESLFLTGTMTWGIYILGAGNSGEVMTWQGIAIYAALGAGAPLGLALQHRFGFAAVAMAAVVLPLLALITTAFVRGVPIVPTKRLPFYRVLGRIWPPGLAMALGTVPFGAMAAFLSLAYSARGWSGAGLALAAFSAAYILVRLFLAGLPDKIGGTSVALISLLTGAGGQLLLWAAPLPTVALMGAAVTGLGSSLVFPSLGVEAMKCIPLQNRGVAVGGYVAFFDLSIGLTGPVVGAIVAAFGYAAAFLTGTVTAALAASLVAFSGRAGFVLRPAMSPDAPRGPIE